MSELLYKPEKTRQDVEELLLQHKNLIYYRLSQCGQLRNQDAESAAWEALWDAIETFNVYEKTAFSTYACHCITNAINTVLRTQQCVNSHIECVSLDASNILFTEDTYEDAEVMRIVDESFRSYMQTCTDLSRDILQLWRASGFSDSATSIAQVCHTSTSYVSRVQCSFRAYLSSRLKDQK